MLLVFVVAGLTKKKRKHYELKCLLSIYWGRGVVGQKWLTNFNSSPSFHIVFVNSDIIGWQVSWQPHSACSAVHSAQPREVIRYVSDRELAMWPFCWVRNYVVD